MTSHFCASRQNYPKQEALSKLAATKLLKPFSLARVAKHFWRSAREPLRCRPQTLNTDQQRSAAYFAKFSNFQELLSMRSKTATF